MTPLFRYTLAAHPAIRQVRSGETLKIDLPDADGLGRDLKPWAAELFEGSCPSTGNPAYGPIEVEGAVPGDALTVEFLALTPGPIARTLLAPNHGFLPDHLLGELRPGQPAPRKPRRMYRWQIEKGVARLLNPIGRQPVTIPLCPFLGCIATAAPVPHGPSTLLAGPQGGNLDHPDLIRGSTLWLPVQAAGGLLYLGDMHAAQGQGEVVGGGLEVGGQVRFRVTLHKKARLRTCRYETKTGRACLAVQGNFEAAAQQALAEMVAWLVESGWNRYDAYLAISQCCEFRPGGLNKTYAVVACYVPKTLFAAPAAP